MQSTVSHSDKAGTLGWCKRIVLVALLAMLALVSVANPAQAAAMNLDIERGAHKAHVSAADDGAYLTYDVKASGDRSLYCGKYTSGIRAASAAGEDAHSVTYAEETTWTSYGEDHRPSTGLTTRTAGAVNGETSRTRNAIRGGNWYWTKKQGVIAPAGERPHLAQIPSLTPESSVCPV